MAICSSGVDWSKVRTWSLRTRNDTVYFREEREHIPPSFTSTLFAIHFPQTSLSEFPSSPLFPPTPRVVVDPLKVHTTLSHFYAFNLTYL